MSKNTPPQQPPLTWSGTLPVHPQYQDSYYAREDGAAESRHVFLDGNALSERFAQTQHRFSVAELGFGTGLNFLLTWQLWDRQRRPGAHLTYVSVEAQPLSADQMRQALSAWPELSARTDRLIAALPAPRAGFQHIHIDTDVTLLLLCADVSEALAQVQLRADAWFLDGFAPSRNPAMWAPVVLERVAALSAPGASFATYSAAGHVRRALTQAGFEVIKGPGFGRKRDMLRGRISTPPATRAEPVWAQPPQPPPSTSTLAVLLVAVFFVTSADSGSLVIDTIASGGADETPRWQRVYWCSLEGLAAALLLLAGGLGALQAATLVAALPFAVIMILLSVGLSRQMFADAAGREIETETPPLGEQVKRILSPARRKDIDRQIERHGLPAMEAVAAALTAEGVETAEVVPSDTGADLVVHHPGWTDFRWSLMATSRALPAFSALNAPEGRRASEWRLTGRGQDGRRHDLTGFTRTQIEAAILEQLERWRRG